MKKQLSRRNRLNLTLSDDETEMVHKLKKKYSINISNYVREAIKNLYEDYEGVTKGS